MPLPMTIEFQGDRIRLQRDQWKNNDAYISNYPGLLEEVKKYTWTYSDGEHPYLNCSKLRVSLHYFVLQFLYGKDNLDEMLEKSNIIEHLDNNGLCTYKTPEHRTKCKIGLGFVIGWFVIGLLIGLASL